MSDIIYGDTSYRDISSLLTTLGMLDAINEIPTTNQTNLDSVIDAILFKRLNTVFKFRDIEYSSINDFKVVVGLTHSSILVRLLNFKMTLPAIVETSKTEQQVLDDIKTKCGSIHDDITTLVCYYGKIVFRNIRTLCVSIGILESDFRKAEKENPNKDKLSTIDYYSSLVTIVINRYYSEYKDSIKNIDAPTNDRKKAYRRSRLAGYSLNEIIIRFNEFDNSEEMKFIKNYEDSEVVGEILLTLKGIKRRCHDKNYASYGRYGGRGISVYPDWLSSFTNPTGSYKFAYYILTTLGPKPKDVNKNGYRVYSIDRINNDGNYEPGNLRWATEKEQLINFSRNVKLIYKGTEYSSISLIAETFNINRATLQNRLNSGWSLEKAIETEVTNTERVYHNGKEYDSLNSFCTINGLSYTFISNKLKEGLSLEEAASLTPKQTSNETVYKGVTYKSLRNLCELNNFNYTSIVKRMSNGMSLEEAIDTKDRDYSVMHDGVKYDSYNHLGKVTGVSPSVVLDKVKTGLSVEAAVRIAKEPTVYKSVTFEGKVYPSVANFCKVNNLSENVIGKGLNRGVSLEDLVRSERERGKDTIVFRGKGYLNLTELCKAYGKNFNDVYNKYNRGMPLEQAMTTDNRDLSIVYKGVGYNSLAQLGKAFNMNDDLIASRMRAGMSLEEAVETEVRARRDSVIYKGVNYNGVSDICNAHGLCAVAFRKRLRNGQEVDQIMEEMLENTTQPITFEGVTYKTLKSLCEANGFKYTRVVKLMKKGMVLEDAVKVKDTDYSVTYNGKLYSTLKELGEAVGVNSKTLGKRINSGLSVEDAVNYKNQ